MLRCFREDYEYYKRIEEVKAISNSMLASVYKSVLGEKILIYSVVQLPCCKYSHQF